MGGEGSMMQMIHTLKNNKSMLSKRKERKALQGSYSSIKLEFPNKATKQDLKRIEEKIIKEQKQVMLKRILVFGFVIITLIIFYI